MVAKSVFIQTKTCTVHFKSQTWEAPYPCRRKWPRYPKRTYFPLRWEKISYKINEEDTLYAIFEISCSPLKNNSGYGLASSMYVSHWIQWHCALFSIISGFNYCTYFPSKSTWGNPGKFWILQFLKTVSESSEHVLEIESYIRASGIRTLRLKIHWLKNNDSVQFT